MKLKKILSGLLAGAIAVTSMVVGSVTASAEGGVLVEKTTLAAWGNVPVNVKEAGTPAAGANIIIELDQTFEVGTGDVWNGMEIFRIITDSWTSPFKVIKLTSAAPSSSTYEFNLENDLGNVSSFYIQNCQKEVAYTVKISDVIPDNRKKIVYEYDGSPIELTVKSGLTATTEVSVEGIDDVEFGVTTVEQLKAAYSMFSVKNFQAKIESVVTSNTSVTLLPEHFNAAMVIYTNDGTEEYNWHASFASSASIEEILADNGGADDSDTITKICCQIYLGDNKPAGLEVGDTITINPAAVKYTITDTTAAAANGSLTISAEEAEKDDTITITAAPSTGYKLSTLTVKEAVSGDTVALTPATVTADTLKYTFAMPADDVTVTATFTEILPETITVISTATSVLVGNTVQLTATVAPSDAKNKAVTWKSSDDTKATVSSTGLVEGVKKGTVTITATSSAKNTVYGTIEIEVTDTKVECTELSVSPTEKTVKEGDTFKLTITKTEGTTDELSLSVSPAGVVTVDDDGTVTAVKAGTAVITATCGSMTATCTVTVEEKEEEVEEPKNPFAYDDISVAPNKKLSAHIDETLKADGTVDNYTDLGAMIINKSEIDCAAYKVTVTATKPDGSTKSIVRYVTKAYPSINMDATDTSGNYSAKGYYAVMIVVKNVPGDWTLKYDFVKADAIPDGAVVLP